jgi:hypothetical protein
MSPLVAKRGDGFEQVPDGIWQAKISNVEDRGICDFGFGNKQYINICWDVYVPGRTMQLKELYNLNFDLKSNLFKRVLSILNTDPGSEFDVTTLIGTVRQIVVQQQPDKKGVMRARISAVLPVNQPAAAAAPTPAPDRAQAMVDALRQQQAAAAAPAPVVAQGERYVPPAVDPTMPF